MSSFSSALARRSKLIFVSGIIGALIALVGSVVMPLEYRADAQILLISQARFGTDPYTAARSSEKIAQNLSEVVGTNDFYEKVVTGRTLDLSRFQGEERAKRKRWQKAVTAGVSYGTGVLNVSAYHKAPAGAVALAQAVSDTLVTQGHEYIGSGVTIKIVNPPVSTKFPARPNIPTNMVMGFALGVVIMSVLVVRRKEM